MVGVHFSVKLCFPDTDTTEVVLSALRDTNLIIHRLTCKFYDEGPFIETQELGESILTGIVSGNVNSLRIQNFCRVQDKRNQYFDFFLQCFSGQQQQKTKRFGYRSLLPITLAEANKFSAAITSNENIKSLRISEFNVQIGGFGPLS